MEVELEVELELEMELELGSFWDGESDDESGNVSGPRSTRVTSLVVFFGPLSKIACAIVSDLSARVTSP